MPYFERRATAEVIRRFNVADGPILPMSFSQTGKTFRVGHIKLPYRMTPEGKWEIHSAMTIDLQGPVLKKDGSDSQNSHSRWPAGNTTGYGEPVHFEGEWQWLNDLIDAARPVGVITYPEVEL